MRRVLTEDVSYDTQYRAVWPDGSVHYITARGRLIRDVAGRPKEVNGVIWDITESEPGGGGTGGDGSSTRAGSEDGITGHPGWWSRS